MVGFKIVTLFADKPDCPNILQNKFLIKFVRDNKVDLDEIEDVQSFIKTIPENIR